MQAVEMNMDSDDEEEEKKEGEGEDPSTFPEFDEAKLYRDQVHCPTAEQDQIMR